jgi:acetyltransferase-like isoleucine patch superfamily enzyme
MKSFEIGENCKIHPSVIINVESGFLGAGSILNEGVRLEGTEIKIGREAFLDRNSTIGGGSCFDPQAFLVAGDWLHMGVNSHVNTARGVTIGHEFGCGIDTKIFTHGAYIDGFSLGAPVQWSGIEIGDSVWLPNAWVNPGVTIGSQVVVAARSLVSRSIPSNSLAGGSPCQVIKENYLPRELSTTEKIEFMNQIFIQTKCRLKKLDSTLKLDFFYEPEAQITTVISFEGKTEFFMKERALFGPASEPSMMLKDQLRRNGVRFRYGNHNGQWKNWNHNPLQIF